MSTYYGAPYTAMRSLFLLSYLAVAAISEIAAVVGVGGGECDASNDAADGSSCDATVVEASLAPPEEEVSVGSSEASHLIFAVSRYGEAQAVEGNDAPKTLDVIRKTILYMENDIYGPNPKYKLSEEILAECTNKHKLCAFWAVIGECEKNPSYMKMKCAPSCQTCDLIDISNRCPPLGDNVRPGLLPGELNAMFERIVNTAPGNRTDHLVIDEGMTNYTVYVHSRPGPLNDNEEPIVSVNSDLEQPPWIISFENFISEEECEHLIDLGYKSEYKRSEDVGKVLPDGTFDSKKSETRTSENAWCSHRNECRNDTVVKRIHDRIAKTYKSSSTNQANFTGYIMITSPIKGIEGATNFPDLNVAVRPKIGRALLWPSVLNGMPMDQEPRTRHEAQDVIKGIKFGANAWLHLHDYVSAKEMGCT
ncbi:hypothetical protein ACHAXA_004721 [Cyclostephanos tholiformis]|uniref:ShKT domain-containing protein n=1 Tax=Cyclostephanos tholiformis TaxID=382380 RepID=A0ABD3SSB7_9STRA